MMNSKPCITYKTPQLYHLIDEKLHQKFLIVGLSSLTVTNYSN